MNQLNMIKITEKNSGEILFQCHPDELEQAYVQARSFEQMGLEIDLSGPSITDTLAFSLGKTEGELEEYNKSVAAELDDHDCLDTAE